MAGDWIKLEHSTPDKPEVSQLAEILKCEPEAALGKMLRLWIWADQQSINGDALSVTEKFIDRVTYTAGFAAALRKVGWLEGREGHLSIPNFDRHNGQTAKSRALTNKRMDKMRGKECDALSVTSASPEKRREEYIDSPTPTRTMPQWETVKEYAIKIGLIEWRARDWFDQMEGCGWVDGNGNPVMKWEAVANRIRTMWESDGRPMQKQPYKKGNYGNSNGNRKTDHFRSEGLKTKVVEFS